MPASKKLTARQMINPDAAQMFTNKCRRPVLTVAVGMLTLFISWLDHWTGSQMDFGVVYLVPVLLAATIDWRLGCAISIASASLSLLTDYALGRHYSGMLYYLWDFGSHTAIYLLVTWLLASLIRARQHEHALARTDPLTGAMNTRAFFEQAELELKRASRSEHPFSMAYIDIDNFKTVNDTFGHKTGDLLLWTVVAVIKKRLRQTDTLARLGGDEFAIFLPETGQEDARAVISQIQGCLMDEVRKQKWPVSFSIGVLTCAGTLPTVEEMIRVADELMYSVKREGKDAVVYAVHAGVIPSDSMG